MSPLKGVIAVLILLLFGVGAYLTRERGSENTTPPESSPSTETSTTDARSAKNGVLPSALNDTDRDGLKDFEETLWKTDPANPDTDGDGSTDGEEVQNDRNPLKKGPNDRLSLPSYRPEENQLPLSTAKQPAPKKTSSPPKDPTDNTSDPTTSTPPPISKPPESPEKIALRAYGNETGGILKTSVNSDAETSAFKEFLKEKPSDTAQAELEQIGNDYGRRVDLLNAISAPSAVQILHAELISRNREQGEAIKRVASFAKSSDISIAEWNRYTEQVTASGKAFFTLALFFKEQGIVFSSHEEGSIFTIPSF